MKPRNSGSLTDQPRISMIFSQCRPAKDGYWRWSPCRSQERGDSLVDLEVVLGGFFFGWIVSPYISWHWPPYVPWDDMIQFWFIVKIISPGFPIWPLGRCKGVKVLGVILTSEWPISFFLLEMRDLNPRAVAFLSILAWRTYQWHNLGRTTAWMDLFFRLWGYFRDTRYTVHESKIPAKNLLSICWFW